MMEAFKEVIAPLLTEEQRAQVEERVGKKAEIKFIGLDRYGHLVDPDTLVYLKKELDELEKQISSEEASSEGEKDEGKAAGRQEDLTMDQILQLAEEVYKTAKASLKDSESVERNADKAGAGAEAGTTRKATNEGDVGKLNLGSLLEELFAEADSEDRKIKQKKKMASK
ncbi:hypothetical protein BGZ94_007118 [Podila epigama]|nr:hypothetical protein BGZ94_007118 [Podila epigama]